MMYNIKNVTIYNTDGPWNFRLQQFKLNTAPSGQCHQTGFSSSTPCYRDTPDRVVDIYTVERCNLISNTSISAGTIFIWNNRYIALTVCEVQAYTGVACSYGYYNTSSFTCKPCDGCFNNNCNPRTGVCIGACKPGFYGAKCDQSCGGCLDSCIEDTGICIGDCKPGFYGTKCKETCSQGCSTTDCNKNGSCSCRNGFHGIKCNETCSKGCSTTHCNKDGSCSCRNGFHGIKCSLECSINCNNNSCTSSSSSPQCTNGCVDGYKGSYCQTPCDVNCRRCDDVSCSLCKPGWFGMKCETRCPTGCKEVCDKTFGICDECKPGVAGLYCNITCTDECRPIDKKKMKSSTCITGIYGDVCTRKCSQLCRQSECQQETGSCIYGCIGGEEVADCSSELNQAGGEASISPVGVGIIGVVVGAFVFGVCGSVIVYICIKRRMHPDQNQTAGENGTPVEERNSNSAESNNYYSTTNNPSTVYRNQSYNENTYDKLDHATDCQTTD